jgi:hypothetical protein
MVATFSFARDLEFASEAELAKRMGCPPALWLRAAVKELIDNALDAAEEAGVQPEIETEVDGHRVTIIDNGPGIAPEVVELLCRRELRTSSREAYAEPARGAQGNALQVLMCLRLGFGLDEAVMTIASRGVVHTITTRVNRLAGRIDVERTVTPGGPAQGTTVTLVWPHAVDLDDEIEVLVTEFLGLNPHVTVNGVAGDPAFRKWRPGTATPVHCYAPDRFANRVLAELRHDPKITVVQFLGRFAGLTSRTRRARIADEAGLQYQPLAALLDASGTALDPDRVELLRREMADASTPPKPSVLGRLGKDHALAALIDLAQSDEADLRGFAYHSAAGDERGVPYVYEVAFAQVIGAAGRRLLVGQNFSPAIDPAAMLDGFLRPAYRGLGNYLDEVEPIALLVHRISPARASLDYGKQRAAIGYTQAYDLSELIRKATARWIKERTRQVRTGRRAEIEDRPPRRRSIKDVVAEHLPAAYARVSSEGKLPARARQIYYAIRPKVLDVTGRKAFGSEYFSTYLLPTFMQENPKICAGWRVHFDPRGTLHEPHTRRQVPLGTAAVERYIAAWTNGKMDFDPPEIGPWRAGTIGPRHRFVAVVIVEKEGIAELLIAAGVDRRFDVAIVGGKGQSVEAALRLADELNLPVLLLHDFDRSGLSIAANIRDGTWRHQYSNRFPVIDVGLRLYQIDGLESEPVFKSESGRGWISDVRLRECGAGEDEIAYLATRRVELNALTTEALVDMVEKALIENGIAKIVPDDETLIAAWRAAQVQIDVGRALRAEVDRATRRWQHQKPPDDIADQIRRRLEEDSLLSWDVVVPEIE